MARLRMHADELSHEIHHVTMSHQADVNILRSLSITFSKLKL